MGVYIDVNTDNNIFENNFEYTINKLCNILSKKLYIFEKDKYHYPYNYKEYLIVKLDYGNNIDEEILVEPNIHITIYDELYNLDFIMSKSCIHYYHDFSYKWHVFKNYLKGDNNIFDKNIEEIIHFSRIFKSTEILIHGDDYYEEEIYNKIMQGEYISDIMKNNNLPYISDIPNKYMNNEIDIFYRKIDVKPIFDINEWLDYFKKTSRHIA